ncbi:phosphoribosylglycinamide formyltransferase [Clostridium hydrogeniformans]|uniref:phosphoribosylglycinamide formyltransferase n=1 Tax=Clostridium hydrogeniformans TaxID=349933 RepID=UPI000489AEC8|nr:phosphoribosylglycinamide formyltransferase [Clostridium hydrogeniformans]
MFKIAVLVSGGGSNLQAIIDNKNLNPYIEMVISDNKDAYGLKRAEKNHIKTYVVDKKVCRETLGDEVLSLVEDKVDLIVLAGFLSILKGDILKVFKDKIINIHPSLIPSFCGKGMYGLNVHRAAIKSGVKISGCTVHFVNENIDEGAIILQNVVEVDFNDNEEDLQKKVMEKEHYILPKAIKLIAENKVRITNGRVEILK